MVGPPKAIFPSDLDQTSDGLINDKTGDREGVWITDTRADAGQGPGRWGGGSAGFPKDLFGSAIPDFSGRTDTHPQIDVARSESWHPFLPLIHPSHPSHPSHVPCVLCSYSARAPRALPRKNELLPRFFTVLPLSVAQTAISDAMEASPAVLGCCKTSDCVRR